jgi:YHS domain-containing protein
MRIIDLVCGRELPEEEALWKASFGDDTFLFCSEECRDEFEREPEEYLDSEQLLELAPES